MQFTRAFGALTARRALIPQDSTERDMNEEMKRLVDEIESVEHRDDPAA